MLRAVNFGLKIDTKLKNVAIIVDFFLPLLCSFDENPQNKIIMFFYTVYLFLNLSSRIRDHSQITFAKSGGEGLVDCKLYYISLM